MKFSVVVPVLDESGIVPDLIAHLAGLDAWETIVVDGGSTDGTREKLSEAGPAWMILLRSGKGRALQMNNGALRASGDVLLFLHADTRLPGGALSTVADALQRNPECRWGRFDVRFDVAGPVLNLAAHAMNLRSAWTSICTGDQALFVYREDFLAIGGFAPIPLMEDIDLTRRLKRRGRPLRVRQPAVTSSRRWRTHGVCRTIGLMWGLRWLYWRGVPAAHLSSRYRGKQ
ncbi:MAG: TIGR04283 family arsenosugar biosynthesis glycosyltransferase [Gammaproteobacteria bacterium]|nr:TIGR04283 family arsenosugar biosynthesis glycosyltransferase [Gammaproteobacteria bacterium]